MQLDSALKDLGKGLGDVLTLVSDVSQGFAIKEFQELITLGEDAHVVLAEAPQMLAQWQGLDDAARADLEAYLQQTISFPASATAQTDILKALKVAVHLSGIYQILMGK